MSENTVGCVGEAVIKTFTGKRFNLLETTPEMICIEDIAHALSLQTRWTGHTNHHYSVAQHSVFCSLLVPEEDALWALMHDSSEAYIADMNRPLKHYSACGKEYLKVEKALMDVICSKFGMSLDQPPSVKVADNLMLFAEARQLMNKAEWDTEWMGEEAHVVIQEITPKEAEVRFLTRFYQLA